MSLSFLAKTTFFTNPKFPGTKSKNQTYCNAEVEKFYDARTFYCRTFKFFDSGLGTDL